ncbi:unnamed protein product [Rotaria sordida]|uniref:Tc1-like transposase DDE domain-containing protein n=1 Tax=Rotaria sordida TaxID=392033 RepID=A0A819I6A5_9BILA|nr:unnamed protein product [Rotaria sordida]
MVAQRAYFFRKMDHLRQENARVYYDDETWCNMGEEKKSIWFNDSGEGRLRKTAGKVDNAPWHSELTDDTKPAKRSYNKAQVQQWLSKHHVIFDSAMTKAELLELASANRPTRHYKIDVEANHFGVEILRLPPKHCALNAMELAWASLKDYVRKNNTNFRLTDVHNLAAEFIAGFDEKAAEKAILHVRKVENTFKKSDCFVEETVEPTLINDDSDCETDDELYKD